MRLALLANLRHPRSTSKGMQRARYRPQLETLESRLTPTTAVLETLLEMNAADGGATPPDTQLAVTPDD